MTSYFLFYCYIVTIWFSLPATKAMACDAEWAAFVLSPSLVSFNNLEITLPKCQADHTLPSSRTTDLLVQLIEAKDPFAIEIAFSSLKQFQGGSLDDVMMSLGLLSESDPKLLLENASAYDISSAAFTNIVLSLPESTVDDVEAKKLRIYERIQRMNGVNDVRLTPLKLRALNALNAEYSNLAGP